MDAKRSLMVMREQRGRVPRHLTQAESSHAQAEAPTPKAEQD
jgi:hypothetical protein